jgi:hypothetical protein
MFGFLLLFEFKYDFKLRDTSKFSGPACGAFTPGQSGAKITEDGAAARRSGSGPALRLTRLG